MAQHIEETINESGMPVNTIAMSNRLIELLKKGNTNCAQSLKGETLLKFKRCLWLIVSQVYGQMGTIDMVDEWKELTKDMEDDNL